MSDITTRAGKGSPLTNAEVDANFDNLNNDKLESVSQSDVTQHQAALSITESQISDLDKYTQSEVDTLLASLEAYDQSLNTTDDVAFASVQLTGGTGDQGKVTWNTDEETLDVVLNGATLQMGQEVHYHVRNNTGSTIADGVPVYATGTLGASGRITVAPYIANGSIPAKYFLGITTESIADGTDGKVTHFGKVRQLDTSAFTDGDVLYPSATTAGALTATAPTGSNIALPSAIVIHAASNGTLFVRATTLDENAYATAAQGALADSALQSGDNVSELTNDAGYATTGYVDTAESDAITSANAYTDGRETAITTAYQTYADQAEADAISTAAADATSKANTAETNAKSYADGIVATEASARSTGDSNTLSSAQSYTDTAISNLVDTAPATLDTLNELAAALGDDPNFATTVSGQIGTAQSTADTALANANAALAKDPTLTLAGDASGSATFTNLGNATLTVTVADDSHNHVISNVDGLQAALDGKVDDSQVLTNVPAGAVFTDTVYTHPSTHPATMITTTDEFAYSNSTNVQDVLDDLDQAIANVNAKDPVITLTGDVSGSGTMTNLGSVSITATVADDSHNHVISNVDGLQAALDGKVDDSQVLTNVPSGAVFTDTVYTHPTYAGDDFSIDTGALTGATVISDIDINVTTDTLGHVTDANATVATRNLTLANLGYTGATNANYYTHPSYAGDDINLDTGALSGATVISDLDFNITTDTQGHVTDANATYSTRNLTAASIGAQPAGTYNTVIGTDSDINTSGATIIDNLYMTDGVITSHGTRTLTLGDLGAGSLASLSSVGAAQITDNSVGAAELNVSGNGTAGEFLSSDGDGTFSWASAGGGAASSTIQVFTSSGTWTKPSGCNKVKVTVVGGGGGGGGLNGSGRMGAGGGAGGCAIEYIDVSATSSVSVTVGSQGNGVTGGAGNAGGTSSFGSFCSANGGAGGARNIYEFSTSQGTAGGTGSGGTINIDGGRGKAPGHYKGGDGGESYFGGGGSGAKSGTSIVSGTSGEAYGSGGGGAASNISNNRNGGNGRAGIVIVEEWY